MHIIDELRGGMLDSLISASATILEVAGIACVIGGAFVATLYYLWVLARTREAGVYRGYRAALGRAILLGLEFLVAADIIATVAIDPSLTSVGVLAGIVLIRTFLSFTLQLEIEGRLPWQPKAPPPAPQEQS
jgi:uncharacterized membrane protein